MRPERREVSNHLARLQDARAHGDRLERQCADQAAALKDAEANVSRCDELERVRTELVDAKAESGKTAAIVAEVRAHLNAAVEREKDAERRAAEAARDVQKGARRVGRPESGSRAGDEHARRRSAGRRAAGQASGEKKTPR